MKKRAPFTPLFAFVAALGPAIAMPRAAWGLTRTPGDALEVETIRSRNPKAAALLEQGEALAVSGALEPADGLFKQAEAEYPDGSLPWRRDCEVLTVLGRRDDAIRSCNEAAQNGHTNLNVRASLRALVVGARPRPADLFVALAIAEDPRRRFAQPDPVLLSADCDIAESVGDARMLEQCVKGLMEVAPADKSTKRALGLLASSCPPWRFWPGWGALGFGVAATAWHSLRRRLRRRGAGAVRAVAAGTFVCAALLAAEHLAWADATSPAAPKPLVAPKGALGKWVVDDVDPAGSIPSDKDRDADPLDFGYWIQDCIMKAEHAAKRGNHATAAKFWAALAVAVPDRAVAYEKLCEEYEALQDYPKAIEACGQGLLRDGLTGDDYARFVRVVLAQPGPVSAKEQLALAQVLEHVKSEDNGRSLYDNLECQVGARTDNVAMLKECTTALRASAPDDPKTISYSWALAIQQNDFTQAKRLIEQAKARGVKVDAIESMQQATSQVARKYWMRLLLWLACTALAAGAAWVAAKALSKKRTAQPA